MTNLRGTLAHCLPGVALAVQLLLLYLPRAAGFEAIHSNQGLTSLPVDRIAPGATKIYLDRNLLTRLHVKQFTPYRACTSIDLSDNRIAVVEDGAFYGLKQLRTLLLGKNRLTHLRMDMFAGTGSELQELHVEQNFIRDIEDGTFTQMGKLVELRMFENRLEKLRPGMFEGLKSLNILLLLSNKLTCLDQHHFSTLPRPLKVSFYGNPLHCDGTLCWMMDEVANRQLSWTVDPYCTSGERWDTLNCSNKNSWKSHCPGPLDVYLWLVPLAIALFFLFVIMLCCVSRRHVVGCCKSEKQKRQLNQRHQGPETQRLRDPRRDEDLEGSQRPGSAQRTVENVYLEEPGVDSELEPLRVNSPNTSHQSQPTAESDQSNADTPLNLLGLSSNTDQSARCSGADVVPSVGSVEEGGANVNATPSQTVPSAPALNEDETLRPTSTPPPPYRTLPPPNHIYAELS